MKISKNLKFTGMKKITIRIIGVFMVAALIFSGCKKWIDTDINVNPDAPADVPMSTILPAAEAGMAFVVIGGTDLCRVTSIWMQQLQGIVRQSQATAVYNLKEGDVNNQWNSTYAESMMNLKQIIAKAGTEHPHYLGVAQILLANALGVTTDIWNDIPFSEAFMGSENLAPKFDTQEQIYQTINALLNDGISNLTVPGNTEAVAGDMIYGGNLENWVKMAYALKARYALHLSKKSPATAYADALAALPNAFASNDDDCSFAFDDPPNANPLYQFMDERAGDITMHSYFIGMLQQRFDPRLPMYATTDINGGYSGNGQGETNPDVSLPGTAVADPTSPVHFITYAECKFIQAECEYVTQAGDPAVRASLYAGVEASMNKHGVLNPLYMAAYDSVLQTMTGPVLFNEIMTQKYIALYYQAEVWVDWRRTGLPQLTSNVAGLEIPRRYPYPTEEITYNPNTPEYGTIWNRVWWDVAN
jgi:hypothetical protein